MSGYLYTITCSEVCGLECSATVQYLTIAAPLKRCTWYVDFSRMSLPHGDFPRQLSLMQGLSTNLFAVVMYSTVVRVNSGDRGDAPPPCRGGGRALVRSRDPPSRGCAKCFPLPRKADRP